MCRKNPHHYTHYSTVCDEGNGVSCDGTCIDCGKECDCGCHGLSAPLFQSNDEVAEWHNPTPKPMLDASDTSNWTVEHHLAWIRQEAGVAMYMSEVKLNVMMTTWAVHGGIGTECMTMDLSKTTDKYREMGVIQ